MAKKKKWAGKAWEGAKEGALTKKGWPNVSKLASYVKNNPGKYGETIRQLLLIANGSKSDEARATAKAAIKSLQKHKPKKKS